MSEVRTPLGARMCLFVTVAFMLIGMGAVGAWDRLYRAEATAHSWALFPASILVVVALGTAFLCYLRQYRLALRALAGLLILVGALIALKLFTNTGALPPAAASLADLGTPTGVILICFSIAFISGSTAAIRTNALIVLCGLLIVTIGAMSFMAAWVEGLARFSIGLRPEADLLFSPLAVVSGLALMGLSPWHGQAPVRIPARVWVASTFCVLISLVGWYAARQYQINDLVQQSHRWVGSIQTDLTSYFQNRQALVRRMSDHWKIAGHLPSQEAFETEVSTYLRDFPDIVFIAAMNAAGNPLYSVSNRTQANELPSLLTSEAWRTQWERHHTHPEPAHLLALPEGPYHSRTGLLVAPLYLADSDIQYLAVLLDYRPYANQLADERTLPLEVSIWSAGNKLLDSSPDIGEKPQTTVSRTAFQPHHDETWRITTYTTGLGFPAAYFYLSSLILFSGGLLSFLLTLSQALGYEAICRNTSYRQLNRRLSDHLEKERKLSHANDRITYFSKDILCSLDSQNRFVKVSPACREVLGYQPPELEGRHLREVVDDADLAETLQMMADARVAFSSSEFRNHCQHPVRGRVALLWSAEWSEEDQVFFCVVRDITAQLTAEMLARERREFFSLTPEMFCILDPNGLFFEVNQSFSEVMGHSHASLVGAPYLDLVVEEDRPKTTQAMEALAGGEIVRGLEFRVADSSGQQHWLQVNAALSNDVLIYCVARDVTPIKEAQIKLQSTLAELERSNQELESFAFVASHDLQEPLRKIQTFADRLISRSDVLPEQERDYLRRMQSAAARMQALIRDLLGYSRIATKAKPFEICDTRAIVSEVLNDMESSLQAEDAIVDIGELPHVLGDRSQIRQVVQNLVSNAIKFHEKTKQPHVAVYGESDGPDSWILCVRDNGVGFDERYSEKIFEPFQRVHRREQFSGTGIGLAVVKKILDRHGAQIAVETSPGEGTLFRITFRNARAEEPA